MITCDVCGAKDAKRVRIHMDIEKREGDAPYGVVDLCPRCSGVVTPDIGKFITDSIRYAVMPPGGNDPEVARGLPHGGIV